MALALQVPSPHMKMCLGELLMMTLALILPMALLMLAALLLTASLVQEMALLLALAFLVILPLCQSPSLQDPGRCL